MVLVKNVAVIKQHKGAFGVPHFVLNELGFVFKNSTVFGGLHEF